MIVLIKTTIISILFDSLSGFTVIDTSPLVFITY